VSLSQRVRRLGEIYVAFADIPAGEHRRGLLPIVLSVRAIPEFVMRLSDFEIAAAKKKVMFRPDSIAATLGFL